MELKKRIEYPKHETTAKRTLRIQVRPKEGTIPRYSSSFWDTYWDVHGSDRNDSLASRLVYNLLKGRK